MSNGHPKMIANDQNKVVCDLLIHSRGQLELDNLLAIEMKKGNSKINSQKDKNRLKLLTTWEENLECVRNTMLGAFVRIKKKSKMGDWYLNNMFMKFVQQCGRSTRNIDDFSKTYVLDGSFWYWFHKAKEKGWFSGNFLRRIKK